MDPDVCLDNIHDTIEKIDWAGNDSEIAVYVEDLAGYIEAMDSWLSNGGFLPSKWSKASAPV